MEVVLFLLGLALGVTGGMFWKYRAYHALQGQLSRLTDRDAKGRFVKREP